MMQLASWRDTMNNMFKNIVSRRRNINSIYKNLTKQDTVNLLVSIFATLLLLFPVYVFYINIFIVELFYKNQLYFHLVIAFLLLCITFSIFENIYIYNIDRDITKEDRRINLLVNTSISFVLSLSFAIPVYFILR